jgi:uncharacterized membrane protein YeaQ/YmgE (transglycosylase-associated protein family)
MLSLLWTALIGLIIGAVAKLLMPGKDPGGIWITMLLGIAGSFLASGWDALWAGIRRVNPPASLCQSSVP